MKIKYSTRKNIHYEQLDDLWKAIGWKPRGKKIWQGVLSKFRFACSAWDGRFLVGFGRILEDGKMCMFYDIGVHPDYQRRGVGKQIMENLIYKVKNKGYVSIGLFTWNKNPKNINYYK